MRVQHCSSTSQEGLPVVLLDDTDQPIALVSGFLRHLAARDYSPNTLVAYAYDLLHFWTFLRQRDLSYQEFTPARSLEFLEYLRQVPSRKRVQRLSLTLCLTEEEGQSATRLSATTINRIFAAVSSFYEYLIGSGGLTEQENPILQVDDPASAWVPDRHRPFLSHALRQRPVRRVVRVKTVQRVARPLSEEQVQHLFGTLHSWRDRAMLWLMLQGGLRPGEVLNLHLEDIQYGRRRVTIRHRTDHPTGVRTKSRRERVVDLHEPEALEALSAYMLHERPQDATSTLIFLVGGKGMRRCEPLSYHALVKLFARHCEQVGMRAPWVTPHSLRHTHATRLWEGGMRELTLQKRLGHASPESTRAYTRVSDPQVVADYRHALGKEGLP
jgi:integrase